MMYVLPNPFPDPLQGTSGPLFGMNLVPPVPYNVDE